MDKRTEINNALKEGMKARDELTVGTLRLVLAALKDRDINARGTGNTGGIGETEILSMMQGMIKQRQESADIFAKNGRPELAEKENGEIAVIRRFLPQQMDEAQMKKTVEGLISELNVSSVKDMGKVMGALKSRYAGQMDMAQASSLIKERLAS